MSGVAVKVYVPTPEEQRLPRAALQTQFFNLGVEHVSLAQLQGKNSKAKNARLAALAEAGEVIKEKLDHYKPTVHPTQNQSTMTVKQVKTLLATPGATEISEADKAKTLAAIAAMSDSQTVVVENTKFGQPLVQHFVEELGLHISRAAIASGNADPLQFMKSLYTKDFPSNLGETMAMDVLVGLHGQYRDQAKPFSQQIKAETVAKVEARLAPLFASADWAGKVSFYMHEVAAVPLEDQRKLQNDDMYKMFWVGGPILFLVICGAYWAEISHVMHARHEQHERVHALLKEHH